MPKKAKKGPSGPILVISDLHMTGGLDPRRGTWSPTEDFFWDDDFAAFLVRYGKGGGSTLVINGDVFDFLQVLNVPTVDELHRYGIPEADRSKRYGLRCSEPAAVFQVDTIFNGHRVAFQALANFLMEGNEVKIIKGNHDVQLFWVSVQERICDRLEELCQSGRRGAIRKNLEFLPWFYYVPGLLYVEHGNQYEEATSFANFLNPVLPFDYPGTGRHIELDLGSFIIRYFSNRMEVLDPLADNYRPLSQFLRSFILNHPLISISTLRDALRYVNKAVTKAYRMKSNRKSGAYRAIVEKNTLLIAKEAERFSGRDEQRGIWLYERLKEFNARTAPPVLSRGPNSFLWNFLRDPIRALVWILPIYLVTYVPAWSNWLEGILTPESRGWGRIMVDVIFMLRVPQLLLAAILVMGALEIRTLQQRARTRKSLLEDPVLRLRGTAAFIADRLGVPFVVFGHTHVEDIQRFSTGSTYFNTGTWISVFSERENLYRNVSQFTFAYFEEGKGELLQWDTARRSARPVIVMDATPYTQKERVRWLPTLWKLIRRR
jgi:UDP-2,3-diacylglucosamine pyrophosphatase LpxH